MTEEQYISVVPLIGACPHTHIGHAKDLGNALYNIVGKYKVIGLSAKSDLFTSQERKIILDRQLEHLGYYQINTQVFNTAGDTLRYAHSLVNRLQGKKILHLVVGEDRKKWGNNLAQAIRDEKIEGVVFDEVLVYVIRGREHGLSGTNMRQAAQKRDLTAYHEHLGSCFSKGQAFQLMIKTHHGLLNKKIKVKRPH